MLIISLVLLFVLTLLSISGINLTLLQERMVANAQTSHRAFQSAEAGLRDGERDLVQNIHPTTVFYPNCTNGLCQPSNTGVPVWRSDQINWSNGTNTIAYGSNTGASALPGLNKQPRYIIEHLQGIGQDEDQTEWYRVTAVGYGPLGRVETMLQSVYRK